MPKVDKLDEGEKSKILEKIKAKLDKAKQDDEVHTAGAVFGQIDEHLKTGVYIK